MNKSENIDALAVSLAKAQAEIEGAAKDKSNPAFRSKYADLGAVWDAIREPLTKHGLSVVQFPRTLFEVGAVEVETILMHASGQYVADVFTIPVSKRDAHGFMSATTYARRGALMAVCGVAPVDDDGNDAAGKGAVQTRDPIAEARAEMPPGPSQYEVNKARKAAAAPPFNLAAQEPSRIDAAWCAGPEAAKWFDAFKADLKMCASVADCAEVQRTHNAELAAFDAHHAERHEKAMALLNKRIEQVST